MGNLDLGSAKSSQEPKKVKAITVTIPGMILVLVALSDQAEKNKVLIDSLKKGMEALTKKEIRKAAFQAYGVKTPKKMKRLKEVEYNILSNIFGEAIWG